MTLAQFTMVTCVAIASAAMGYMVGADTHWLLGLRAGAAGAFRMARNRGWIQWYYDGCHPVLVTEVLDIQNHDAQAHERTQRQVAGGLALLAALVAVFAACCVMVWP